MAFSLVSLFPFLLLSLGQTLEEEILERGRLTPALICHSASGSVESVLNTLYFEGESPLPIRREQLFSLEEEGLALDSLAILTGMEVQVGDRTLPLVGVEPKYAVFRDLPVRGSWCHGVGEFVCSEALAQELGLKLGDTLITRPLALRDLRKSAPIKGRLVGTFSATMSPDDRVFFTSLETQWVARGLGHGHGHDEAHQAIGEAEANLHRLTEAGTRDFTKGAEHGVHFHEPLHSLPLSAIILLPKTPRDDLIARAALEKIEGLQWVRPLDVSTRLLEHFFRIRNTLTLHALFSTGAALLLVFLILRLTLDLRRSELDLFDQLSYPRRTFYLSLVLEGLLYLTVAFALALAIALPLAHRWGASLLG